MREFKSFYKTVEGNEGNKCHYPTRLDTYGCGCQHDCKYCYAKSLLEFRDLWNSKDPSVADIKKVENKVKTLQKGSVVRLGGMTDCFQPCEKTHRITYKTIQLLNKQGVHYLIVTKSDMVADDEYVKILDKKLAHIQITVTSTDDKIAATYEKAVPSSRRMRAIEKLEALGFDVQIRLSPFIPEYIDLGVIENLKCKRAIVEFLRVNAFIKRTFDLNYSQFTVKEGNYNHLPLEIKKKWIDAISKTKEVSVCEDQSDAYEYWRDHVNPFPDDCCNLHFDNDIKSIGDMSLLQEPKTAYLCSMTEDNFVLAKSKKWAESYRDKDICVISGFQSPAERVVLETLLEGKAKIVLVLARKMFKTCPEKYKKAVKDGRMLIISPFANCENVTTKEFAKKRNQYVMDHSNNMILGTVSRNGMLESMVKTYKLPHKVLV